MTLYLTNPNPDLARLVARTPKSSMMHWSGGCSDPSATCGGCKHYGFTEVIRDDVGNAITTQSHPTSCALYYKHMSKAGKSLYRGTLACKYFEAKKP